MKYEKLVLQYLVMIPKGKVSTYKDIANYIGNPKLVRVVGNILHYNKDGIKYPCYKIVNSHGMLSSNYAFGGLEEQKKRLEADGIDVINNKVALEKYLFNMEEK